MASNASWDYTTGSLGVCFRCKTTRPMRYLEEGTVTAKDGKTGKVLICKRDPETPQNRDPISALLRPMPGPEDMCEWQLYAMSLDGRRVLSGPERLFIRDELMMISNTRFSKFLKSPFRKAAFELMKLKKRIPKGKGTKEWNDFGDNLVEVLKQLAKEQRSKKHGH